MDFLSYFDFSVTEAVLLGIFALLILIEFFFYLYFFRAPLCYARKQRQNDDLKKQSSLPSVSVVVVSTDSAHHLEKNLPLILGQEYPDFEVIVVNDESTDETDQLLKSLKAQYSNLYGTYLPLSRDTIFGRKKLAMTIGVKAAKKEIVLFTEAYCRPVSDQWIASMVAQFSENTSLVAGYTCISKSSSMVSRSIAFDNLAYSLQYLSMIIRRKPFSATFRNFAMRKEVFFRHKGFASVLNHEHGEELFLNHITADENTEVCLHPEAFVELTLDKSERFVWREYRIVYQRIKRYFKGIGSWIFNLESLSRYAILVLWCAVLVKGILDFRYGAIAIATVLLLALTAVQLVVINKSAKWLKSGKFYFSWFVFNLKQPLRNLSFKHRKDKSRRTVGSH